jgi:hypothetical protein
VTGLNFFPEAKVQAVITVKKTPPMKIYEPVSGEIVFRESNSFKLHISGVLTE